MQTTPEMVVQETEIHEFRAVGLGWPENVSRETSADLYRREGHKIGLGWPQ